MSSSKPFSLSWLLNPEEPIDTSHRTLPKPNFANTDPPNSTPNHSDPNTSEHVSFLLPKPVPPPTPPTIPVARLLPSGPSSSTMITHYLGNLRDMPVISDAPARPFDLGPRGPLRRLSVPPHPIHFTSLQPTVPQTSPTLINSRPNNFHVPQQPQQKVRNVMHSLPQPLPRALTSSSGSGGGGRTPCMSDLPLSSSSTFIPPPPPQNQTTASAAAASRSKFSNHHTTSSSSTTSNRLTMAALSPPTFVRSVPLSLAKNSPQGQEDRAKWGHPDRVEFLIRSYLQSVKDGYVTSYGLKRSQWRRIQTSFNKKFGIFHSVEQLKNGFANIKRQYKDTKFLKEQPGWLWDHEQNFVLNTAEEWKLISQKFPQRYFSRLIDVRTRASWRSKPLELYPGNV